MDLGFAESLAIAGLLLTVAAGLSGVMRGTVLSISVLAVGAGISLALLDVISVSPGDPALVEIVELALILTLFADGLVVEREFLRLHWAPPTRAIAIAMPLTLIALALGAKAIFPELAWAEAFLLGAVLSPTDPVVTSAIVASTRVPSVVRHTLNLESGLNDGLAVPFVLFFLTLAEAETGAGGEAATLLGEAGAGVAIGAALGVVGGMLLHRLPGGGVTHRYQGLYALGLGLLAFGAAELTIGNGLLAAFAAGVTLGMAEHELSESFVTFNENLSAIFQVVTFVLFGALIVAAGYHESIPALVGFILFALLVARPLCIAIAFLRSRVPAPQRAFIAWFGPKGVASMLFALFVLNSEATERTVVFEVAAFVILASILAHGLTDTVGARWIEERMPAGEEPDERGDVPGRPLR
jgi:NhaP-type Na+/H+ or K+/H+ antiporter